MLRSTIIIAAIALLAVPTLAADQNPSAPRPPREKKLCRSAPSTGSIMPTRVCHTRAEWGAIDQRNGVNAETQLDNQRRGLGNTGGNVPAG